MPMPVNATSGSTGVFDTSAQDPATFLTGEALLTYCQCQLQNIDGDVKQYIDQQKLVMKKKELLSNIENAMKKGPFHMDWDEVAAAFDRAIAALPPGDPTRTTLEAQKFQIWDDYGEGNGPPNKGRGPTQEEWNAEVGEVTALIDDIRGSAELNMIQLQSIMSQRQTVVQLTTSLMSKLDQSLQTAAKNI